MALRTLIAQPRPALGLTILLGLLVFACGVPAQPGSLDNTQPTSADIRGSITNIFPVGERGIIGTVLIEGVKESDTQVDKASVTVNEQTRIYEQRGSERRAITFDALKLGQRVEAQFIGGVAESFPVQATAREIVVLGGP